MIPIPFSLPDNGLRERSGTVTVEGDELVVRIEDKLLGLMDSERTTIRIDVNALADVVLRHRPLYDRLIVVPVRPAELDAVPGLFGGALEMRVWRGHRRALEELTDMLDGLR
jgi:hypothetical protein